MLKTFRRGGFCSGRVLFAFLRCAGLICEAAGEGDDAHAAELVAAAGDADDLVVWVEQAQAVAAVGDAVVYEEHEHAVARGVVAVVEVFADVARPTAEALRALLAEATVGPSVAGRARRALVFDQLARAEAHARRGAERRGGGGRARGTGGGLGG